MIISLEIVIEVSTEIIAKKVIQAVITDVNSASDYFERSVIKIRNQRNLIRLNISANDIIAAKSSINSVLLWLENSIDIIEKFS
ncbi:MAG: KEOPS complex subunit Pcc1 [Candidatus Hodarchaeales archaeon]|jgi:tRNA threonylcarbamoyladenosine modification (KEOPS) complex  Pcc1 subunit